MNKVLYINTRIKHREQKNFQLYYLSILVLFALKIVFVNSVTKKEIIIFNYYFSEIHLVIQGNGNQKILYIGFNLDHLKFI